MDRATALKLLGDPTGIEEEELLEAERIVIEDTDNTPTAEDGAQPPELEDDSLDRPPVDAVVEEAGL